MESASDPVPTALSAHPPLPLSLSLSLSKINIFLKMWLDRSTWVAQSVKHRILGLSSGHDLTVGMIEPYTGLCADSAEPAWDPRPPLRLFLKINK